MAEPTHRRRRQHRRSRADELLVGYVTGPAAATEATTRAVSRLGDARTILLVEGVSDQIAVETLARLRGRDLASERVVVVPIGGAQAIGRFLESCDRDVRLGGLCDTAEESVYRAALTAAGVARCESRADLERAGFFVCEVDLEDELIRAVGADGVEQVFEREDELGSFRTMQQQPPWRDRSIEQQMRRFLGAGARRKARYARLLVEEVDADRTPWPLQALVHSTVDHA